MKKEVFLLKMLLFLTVSMFLVLVADLMSLHDIRNDYISKEALENLRMSSLTDPPWWTDTRAEWSVIQTGFLIKVVIAATNMVLILLLWKNYRRKQ